MSIEHNIQKERFIFHMDSITFDNMELVDKAKRKVNQIRREKTAGTGMAIQPFERARDVRKKLGGESEITLPWQEEEKEQPGGPPNEGEPTIETTPPIKRPKTEEGKELVL